MKKIIFAAIIAVLMFAGCGAEPEPKLPIEAIGTAPVEFSANIEERFEFGQIVWNVIRSEDGGEAYLIRSMVFAQDGELVSVIPMFSPDPDEVREVLETVAQMPKGEAGYLDLVMVNNCYLDRDEAQAAADRENGEVEG